MHSLRAPRAISAQWLDQAGARAGLNQGPNMHCACACMRRLISGAVPDRRRAHACKHHRVPRHGGAPAKADKTNKQSNKPLSMHDWV